MAGAPRSACRRGQLILKGWQAWATERHRPEDGFPGLPYVMLHSLSHMLMTSISLDCGYPASSLRERVYVRRRRLRHTDLHGIIRFRRDAGRAWSRLGRHLAVHIRRALIDDGQLCSNDPVCAEHAPDSES